MQTPISRHDLAAASPLGMLWRAPVIAWVLIAGEGLAIVLALAPGIQGNRWAYLGLTSLVVQWVALLTLGGLYLLRHRLWNLRPHYVAWIALTLLVACTWLIGGLAWLVPWELWPMEAGEWLYLCMRLTAMVLTVGLLGLAAFQNHWRARQLAVRAKQAELEALHARIHPHFLFNTLNTGAALVHARPGEAEQLLLDLADLFRAALAGPREIPLADELALTRRYLKIESLRFGDRLHLQWEVETALPDVLVPALSIQPLVENAIRHGVETAAAGGDVRVHTRLQDKTLQVVVSNSLPDIQKANSGHKVGQHSARERIEAATGGLGRLDAGIQDGRYVAIVTLPLPDGIPTGA